jgi:hypothetical protein
MSLRAFHVLFISASVLLALGVGWWCLPSRPVGAGAALVVAMGLVAYETWFLRKTRKLP